MIAVRSRIVAVAGVLAFAVGCQQRMAEQPAPRPYEQSAMFRHNQSARPLEKGVVHRNQPVEGDPLVTWLTAQGRSPKVDPEWKKRVDPEGNLTPPPGAPTDAANFVNEFPFRLTEADLKRGQVLYNANCALCHGAAGWGNGKIPERGFLRPPSYHTDPAGKAFDWSTMGADGPRYNAELPQGYSRGFGRYGVKLAIKDAPVGYLFQVITWGYGGMASHEVQLANPADRWRVIGYIRALQFSQAADEAALPADAKARLSIAGGTK